MGDATRSGQGPEHCWPQASCRNVPLQSAMGSTGLWPVARGRHCSRVVWVLRRVSVEKQPPASPHAPRLLHFGDVPQQPDKTRFVAEGKLISSCLCLHSYYSYHLPKKALCLEGCFHLCFQHSFLKELPFPSFPFCTRWAALPMTPVLSSSLPQGLQSAISRLGPTLLWTHPEISASIKAHQFLC